VSIAAMLTSTFLFADVNSNQFCLASQFGIYGYTLFGPFLANFELFAVSVANTHMLEHCYTDIEISAKEYF